MKWKTHPRNLWLPWFAWFPVRTYDGCIVWLEQIERFEVSTNWDKFWQYRIPK